MDERCCFAYKNSDKKVNQLKPTFSFEIHFIPQLWFTPWVDCIQFNYSLWLFHIMYAAGHAPCLDLGLGQVQDDISPDINLYFITFNSNLVVKHFLHILAEYKIRISLLQSNWL